MNGKGLCSKCVEALDCISPGQGVCCQLCEKCSIQDAGLYLAKKTEKTIEYTFKISCETILKEDLKDHEFEFVKRSIMNFLEYYSEKRRTRGVL